MSKIYTKKGDEGFTSGLGGRRVRKSHVRCEAMGTIDELNAHIGLCLQAAGGGEGESIANALRPIQTELLAIGAMLAAPDSDSGVAIGDPPVQRMEHLIDALCRQLGELTQFIVPGGCELSCLLHVARTVCRRAERRVTADADSHLQPPPIILRYLNRLGDLLFVLAREANSRAGYREVLWDRKQH